MNKMPRKVRVRRNTQSPINRPEPKVGDIYFANALSWLPVGTKFHHYLEDPVEVRDAWEVIEPGRYIVTLLNDVAKPTTQGFPIEGERYKIDEVPIDQVVTEFDYDKLVESIRQGIMNHPDFVNTQSITDQITGHLSAATTVCKEVRWAQPGSDGVIQIYHGLNTNDLFVQVWENNYPCKEVNRLQISCVNTGQIEIRGFTNFNTYKVVMIG